MKCHDAQKQIPAYIDGLLDFDESFAVRQHISTCNDCYEVFRAFERDEAAVTNYVHRAPFAPVARDVIDQIDRGRSPWWDALMAGSYRLASVAGLVLVILVVAAGAFALREMAMSDGEEEPPQETMMATDDRAEEASISETSEESEPLLLGQGDIPRIVERLDENGLVFDVNQTSETDDYTIEYRRVAVDRHLFFVEYRAERHSDDADVVLRAMLGGGGDQPIPFEDGTAEGWMVFQNSSAHDSVLELSDYAMDGSGVQNTHEVDLDLSPMPTGDAQRYAFDNAVENNGVELCCLVVEQGVAVSIVSWEWEILDTDDVVYLDESMQPVDDPPELDATADPVWPEITVNGEQLPVLDRSFGISSDGNEYPRGVFGLPQEGMLEVHNERMMLPTDGENSNPTYFQGPWTLQAELEQPEAEPEPTPEPTTPPNVAEDDESTSGEAAQGDAGAEPDETPDQAAGDDQLRVLVYLMRDGELAAAAREIDYTQDVATAAIEELFDGLTRDEQNFELATAVPEGTELLDIELEAGTVTVDLSEEFASGGIEHQRVAQVVHTLTQFDTIDEVDFLVEGEPAYQHGVDGLVIDQPVDREDFETEAPAILIEHPAPGEIVSGPIRLRGTANTFEANLQIEVIGPNGEQVYRDHAMASSGTGTRGEFDVQVPVDVSEEGWGTIRMFEHSARDGSRTNVVDIPVRFEAE